jgi:hypothetical protein
MIERFGDMFAVPTDNLLVTTNCIVKDNGRLVMGAGAALTAKQHFPGIDKVFGTVVSLKGSLCGCIPRLYHHVGMFQTKYHYGQNSDLELIKFSSEMLMEYALRRPTESFSLNYPGINHGKLSVDVVYPIIKFLPDNVTVWRNR